MRAPRWATGAAIVTVLATWTATLIVDMLVAEYSPPTGIEPLMMALAAFLFAAQPRDAKRRTDEELDNDAD